MRPLPQPPQIRRILAFGMYRLMRIAAHIYSKAASRKGFTKMFRFGKTIFSHLLILVDGVDTHYSFYRVPGLYFRHNSASSLAPTLADKHRGS
jgi:hypothetical protein